jgi:hypothetical protein
VMLTTGWRSWCSTCQWDTRMSQGINTHYYYYAICRARGLATVHVWRN